MDIEEILGNYGGFSINNLSDIFEPDNDDSEPLITGTSP